MKTNKIIFFLFLLLIIGLLTFRFSLSYFSDSGSSTENILAASAEFPTPTLTITPTPPSVTPTPQIANHVVISEVQLGESGVGNSDHDFVEFYNPTSTPFDLNGHRLVRRTGSSPSDDTIKSWITTAIIPAHGFYLWASSDDGYATTISADASTSDNIATANSIALRFGLENAGTIIDQLSWNSASQSLKEGTEFSPDPGDNESLERKAYTSSTATSMGSGGTDETKGNGFDANNNLTDFYIRAISQPQNSSVTETP